MSHSEDELMSWSCGGSSCGSVSTSVSVSSKTACLSIEEKEDETKSQLTILDGTFYQLIPNKCTPTNLTAICIKCKPSLVEIKGNRHSTSNFMSHLKRKHGDNALTEYKNHILNKKNKHIENTVNEKSSSKTNVSGKIRINQKDFETKLSKFVIHSMIPFRVIENKYFSEIMHDVGIDSFGLKLPSRRCLVKNVEELFNQNIKNIRETFKKIDYVCTTADIWSGKKRSFLGVTAHWISKDFERKTAALACRRFAKTHSYDRIAELLQDIHLNFGLTHQKVVATVTDNGSNFVKAFKKFGVDKKAIEKSNEDDDIPENVEESDFAQSSSDSEDEVASSSKLSSNFSTEMEKVLPNHLRCASHTLHLCATTDVKNGYKNYPSLANYHRQVLAKCSALWNFSSRPKSAETMQEILGHTLSRPGETRWNSLFDSLRQMRSIKEKCNDLYINLKVKTNEQLTLEDFVYISEYLECSEPLALALDILQGENNVFFGMLLPALVSLQRKFMDLKQKPWIYCAPLVNIYISSINKRFEEFFNISSKTAESAAIAAFSNPVFKKRWLGCIDAQHHVRIQQLFKGAVMKELTENDTTDSTPSSSLSAQEASRFNEFFDFGGNSSELVATDQQESKAEMQISNFFFSECTELKSLEAFPAIKRVFVKFNTPIPSSAAVERLFSFASITNNPKSNRLSDKNFEMRVVLKANVV